MARLVEITQIPDYANRLSCFIIGRPSLCQLLQCCGLASASFGSQERRLSIRKELRDLLESREQVKIQAKAVSVAEKRQKSVKMFLDAGRAEIRDLLDAQDSLLSAQNQLTASIINYRIAELNIQRDMGVLEIDETGLWQEFTPEGINDEKP